MQKLFLVAFGGAAGAVSRYLVSGWSYRLLGDRFAYGTLIVNVAGCFLLGVLMQLSLATDILPRHARMVLGVGFMGAFTTFSTFGYETFRYLEDGSWWLAAANVIGNLVLGGMAVWLGVFISQMIWGGG